MNDSLARTRMIRNTVIAKNIVVTNGIAGCGKTLVSAIISSLDRMELEKFDFSIEWALQLSHLGRIQDDAVRTLVRTHCDLDLYNQMMSRETNFRFSDLSGVFSNPRPWRYVRRLYAPGDGAVMPRIDADAPILNLVTHNLLSIGKPLFDALGERLRFIEVVRHPLYMLKQWRLFMPRYAKDPRHFSLWIEVDGNILPWFAQGWEELYLRSNMMDRVILSIDRLLALCERTRGALSEEERARFMVIPFEPFVLTPAPYMRRLTSFIGTTSGRVTERELRRQKVPRKMIAEGIDLKIYRENGWRPPKEGDEAAELKIRRDFAAAEASAEGMAVLDRLCRDYEARYLKDTPGFSR